MHKIKVSHEVPICLFEHNKKWSDYDYVLPHLLDKFPEYEKYMREAKAKDRYIIMDNSLHELGKPYSEDRLIHWVNEIQPNEFIVPDLWENSIGTLQLATHWMDKTLPDKVTKVAVVQAKSYDAAVNLYLAYKKLGYKKIAFSYGAEYFNKVCPHVNRHLGKALGRVQTVIQMYNKGIIEDTDRVHLLGCQVPQEFSWYNGMKFIESLDTSNPIIAGYESTFYNSYGLDFKPKTKIDDIIDIKYQDIEIKMEVIRYNVNKFKSLNNLF
jgi:hypothetical protein